MNYAIKTPDGLGLHKVILGQELPAGKTPEEMDLWPVDIKIPDGYRQDFSLGSIGSRGWQLVAGVVVPILMPVEPPPDEPATPSIEQRLADLESKQAEITSKQTALESDVTTLKQAKP